VQPWSRNHSGGTPTRRQNGGDCRQHGKSAGADQYRGQHTARAIAQQIGIEDPKAELLPTDKVQAATDLVEQFHKVGMVGDGVNDAPAMAAATTGIAMGTVGTDTTLETADIVLMGDDLSRLPFAVRLSRKTLRAISQNISLALGLKTIFLVLAIPGYATLWMAVFADMGASLLVIANSLRLLRLRESVSSRTNTDDSLAT